jgi:hypothetical protein
MQRYSWVKDINEEPHIKIFSPQIITASKNHLASESDSTPLEYPELYELNIKVSQFFSPNLEIEIEASIPSIPEFLSSEVIEFDAFKNY